MGVEEDPPSNAEISFRRMCKNILQTLVGVNLKHGSKGDFMVAYSREFDPPRIEFLFAPWFWQCGGADDLIQVLGHSLFMNGFVDLAIPHRQELLKEGGGKGWYLACWEVVSMGRFEGLN